MKHNKGFILIELLVVISIIGVLATMIFSSISEAQMKARNAKRMRELRQLVPVIEMYKLDNNGNAPEGFCYMNAANPTCLIQLINRGYLSKIPHDPTAGNNNQLSYAYCNYDTTLTNGRCDRLTSPNYRRTWVITFRLEGDPDNYCISAASGIYKTNTKPKGSGESSTACVQED